MLATAMIFCVVPPELADELFEKLTKHYADDPNVTVIIDQRKTARRGQGAETPDGQRRELRDRRRRRIAGDLPPLEGE
ncbi:MAG: hypothetical protein QOE44_1006 [Solirubrobacteraceae bacterium]|jgi:hypothetical protein|nr:hypothetical protein [Solirubrobacteraceae bacterium]